MLVDPTVQQLLNREIDRRDKRIAPATFLGTQSGFGVRPDIELFNLTADIPGHPRGSTVSAETLQRAGFTLPTR